MIDRKSVLTKLDDFVDGRMTPAQLYEWVLAVAVSEDYDAVIQRDPVTGHTLQELLEISRSDEVPYYQKRLAYCRSGLLGETPFSAAELEQIKLESNKEQKSAKLEIMSQESAPKDGWDRFMVIARFYSILFAASSLIFQIVRLLFPQAIELEKILPSDDDLLNATLPHILYAVVILMPPRILAKGVVFWAAFPILMLGMFFYWYLCGSIITKLGLSMMFMFVASPFSGIPATLAFLLVFLRREERRQPIRLAGTSKVLKNLNH